MHTKLIQLNDGTRVEVEVSEQAEAISGGALNKVSTGFEIIQPLIWNISNSISQSWKELKNQACVEEIEIELGLSFEAEGNIFVTKAKAGSNLTVRLKLKAKADE